MTPRDPAVNSAIRVLLVNLPHHERVQRRWVASYYAPNFLIPPLELMGLASYLRDVVGAEVALTDAIAEDLSVEDVVARHRDQAPSVVIALAGFRILNEDLAALGALRDQLGGAVSVIFGYLPTQAPEVVAQHPGVDFVVRGEPEHTIGGLIDALRTGAAPQSVDGLAFRGSDRVVLTPSRPRLEELDLLPYPDHDLVDLSLYNESFVPRPIGVVTTARGCPFACSFCVRAYGRKLACRSWQNIAQELMTLRRKGIRNVRFLDDTFTVERSRVVNLCRFVEAALPDLRWTCLTRLDRIDPELAQAMARAGCRRIYAGVESANEDRLEAWGKGITRAQIEAGVAAARNAGIEVSGFFIVGAPGETLEEATASADFAASLGLDWVIATRLQYWPGTRLTAGREGAIEFELDGAEPGLAPEQDASLYALEKRFYRRFYLRPGWAVRRLGRVARTPRDTVAGAIGLARYLAAPTPTRDFI